VTKHIHASGGRFTYPNRRAGRSFGRADQLTGPMAWLGWSFGWADHATARAAPPQRVARLVVRAHGR
jgi:hypothetical protein